MKSFVMITVLCMAFAAEARPSTGKASSLQQSLQQIMGKAKRGWLRSSVGKKKTQSWLALVALPAVLLTAPVKADVEARPLTQGLANLSQRMHAGTGGILHKNSYSNGLSEASTINYTDNFSEAPTLNYTNDRSWILYYGGGNGAIAQGEQFQTYYTEIPWFRLS